MDAGKELGAGTARSAAGNERLAGLLRRFVAAQLAGDQREALRVVVDDGLEAGVPVRDIVLDVLQPAQYEIGRLWQENRISVAQEHLATAITQLVMAHLYPHLPRAAATGKRALVACVEGELHDMGARVTADFLEMSGYEVRYLGASVPTESLVAMVERERPDLLALSTTIPTHVPALQDAVRRVCAATHGRLPIMVGGGALAALEGGAWQDGNVISCATVDEMLGAVGKLVKDAACRAAAAR